MAESEASLDERLALKKRARRRLVGAAALALLAAIVLPMVMDREPRPANQDIQVRIPSQDATTGIAAKVLPAKPTATPLPPAVVPAEEAPAAESKAEAKADSAPATKAEPAKPEAASAKLAAAAPEKPGEKPSAKPAEKAADKPVEKAADKPAEAKKVDEARAATALAGDSAEWVIQLGAYKEAGNVKLLMSKLKGMGVPAYTEKFDSPQGLRTRVRAGPFASKEAAEKAKVKVKVIGVDGPIAQK